MLLRRYTPSDIPAMAELFFRTIHSVCAKDYTPAQLYAWAPAPPDPTCWAASFSGKICFVAFEHGILTGFGDMDGSGYLDRLYIHAAYQRRGIASAICDRLEAATHTDIVTHASMTAKPFFAKRGYLLIQEQQVCRHGIFLTNYVMKKRNARMMYAER